MHCKYCRENEGCVYEQPLLDIWDLRTLPCEREVAYRCPLTDAVREGLSPPLSDHLPQRWLLERVRDLSE
ncbi:MAG: hypothetical protein HY520_00500 [Candidatus Aenigmarchaeota archaeon]|nr:hypothetical protein [Candidatus Aenigmarchaeota archaeon]